MLPIPVKTVVISFYDPRMDMFKDIFELSRLTSVLGDIAVDFTNKQPIANFACNWPPRDYILAKLKEDSELTILYNVLDGLLAQCGYTLPVLSTLSVMSHVPKANTLISVNTQFRYGTAQ